MEKSNQTDLTSLVNTLNATPWEMLRARLFGRKVRRKDSTGIVVIEIEYKGKAYFLDYEKQEADKPEKMSYRYYTFFKCLGNVATICLTYMVLRLSDFDWSVLWWFVPLLLLNEFGCYAERDRKHEHGV